MTGSALLEVIQEVAKKKRRRAVKIWDVMEAAQKQELVTREEIWMLLRSLEKKAYVDIIKAHDAGVIGVSITPLGQAQVT